MKKQEDFGMFRLLGAYGMVSMLASAACAQAVVPPSFETAEVKANQSGDREVAFELMPGGKLTLRNVTMRDMVAGAYRVADYAVEGPEWLDKDRFDVTARAAPETSEADLRRMLQNLLADRFKLAIHFDRKSKSLYALVRGSGEPKMEKSSAENAENSGCGGQPAHLTCKGLTMEDLAETLPRMASRDIDKPVVDLTELKGAYDIKLDWTLSSAGAGTPAMTIFDAIRTQLGLRLEARTVPVDVIVIDRVERVLSPK